MRKIDVTMRPERVKGAIPGRVAKRTPTYARPPELVERDFDNFRPERACPPQNLRALFERRTCAQNLKLQDFLSRLPRPFLF